jgi:diguanylate cyclase (GGDEF)-like protein
MIALGVFFIPLFAPNKTNSWLIVGVVLCAIVSARILLALGHVNAASLLLVGIGLFCASAFLLLSGGTTYAGVAYLAAATIMSGVLLGRRGALGATILSILVSLLVLIIDLAQVPFPQMFHMTPVLGWVALIVSLTMTTLLVSYSTLSLSSALHIAHEQIQARQKAEAELRKMATTDHLTGLFNRHSFFALANQMLGDTIQTQRNIALAMVDLDHFKQLNDTYGHITGDQILSAIAAVLSQAVRTSDVIARYGGEEFILVLKDTNEASALRLAERMRLQIAEQEFSANGDLIHITLSVGITVYNPSEPPVLIDDLILQADHALYSAKQNGRNCCMIYSNNAIRPR